MNNARTYSPVILVMCLSVLACGSSAPTDTSEQAQPNVATEPSVSAEVPTRTPFTKFPTSSPQPTTALLQLEVVQSQVWTDRDGHARANVLFRNPYDFPVVIGSNPRATLVNGAGEFMRDDLLYFLDGISGGGGFLLPGETIAANACFTCEEALMTEPWADIQFVTRALDGTGKWNYFTDVEASGVSVTFFGDNPLFDVSASVKNNSSSALRRIAVRVIVLDQNGDLVGAAELSAWDVAAGATVSVSGYGIGQKPDGSVTYEASALGVNY